MTQTVEKRLPTVSEPGQQIGMIFFELQTGIYKRDDWPSTYYHYRLRNSHPETNQYTVSWLKEAVANAYLDEEGLKYSADFIYQLTRAEMDAEETIRLFLRMYPDRREDIPQKLA